MSDNGHNIPEYLAELENISLGRTNTKEIS
jgi:hypothetical protein